MVCQVLLGIVEPAFPTRSTGIFEGQPWATQKFLHHAAIQVLPRERASFSQRPEDSTAECCNRCDDH